MTWLDDVILDLELADAVPSILAATGQAGTQSAASRSDHVHGHGAQSGGTQHAQAATASAGFAPAVGGTANRVVATSNGTTLSMVQVSNAMLASELAHSSDSFTPGLTGRTTPGTQTYSTNLGSYQKIGSLVFVRGEVVLTANSGGSGDAIIILPFTAASTIMSAISLAYISNVSFTSSAYTWFTIGVDPGSTRGILFENQGGGSRHNVAITQVAADGKLSFSGVYLT
jgi:hypothetical protein